jgi:hypothetical protein
MFAGPGVLIKQSAGKKVTSPCFVSVETQELDNILDAAAGGNICGKIKSSVSNQLTLLANLQERGVSRGKSQEL